MKNDRIKLGKLLSVSLVAAVLVACTTTDTATGPGSSSDGSVTSTPGGSQAGVSTQSMQNDGMDAKPFQTIFYFDYDQSALTTLAREALDAQATRLTNGSGVIRLEGHADERGSREYNLALGERRAKAVANYLAIQGIEVSRVETVSYGEEKPVAYGQGESSYNLNRRVELKDY